MSQSDRRVVITGMGQISPLGNSIESMWNHLSTGKSGVGMLQTVPVENLTTDIGGECSDFDGSIGNFGSPDKLLKRNIKKALKLMCREIQVGVAAAQLAIENAGLVGADKDPTSIGTMFGSDYIITSPEEYSAGIAECLSDTGDFDFEKWAEQGIPKVEPTWLLKYLPNMPASHVAIFNDLQGPSNSLTVREASSNIAIGESVTIIRRGNADIMVTGATGSRIHPLRTIHVCLQEQLADRNSAAAGGDAAKACRPFDVDRSGMVMGEGAAVMILESLDSAQSRGATILGEVVGYGSSAVMLPEGTADYKTSLSNAIASALEVAKVNADSIGHVHAHGLGGLRCDEEESAAIIEQLGDTPVTAAKSYMGNLGAGSGMVEAISSVVAMQKNELFPVLNCDSVDPKCKLNVVTKKTAPGDSFINLNVTPQGQASATIVKRFEK